MIYTISASETNIAQDDNNSSRLANPCSSGLLVPIDAKKSNSCRENGVASERNARAGCRGWQSLLEEC